jgi:hypothetical protein
MKNSIIKVKMTSLLQMRAQFESLTTQYDDNLAEMATCAARNDEGMSFSDKIKDHPFCSP